MNNKEGRQSCVNLFYKHKLCVRRLSSVLSGNINLDLNLKLEH